ncbi:MAG: Gfo/Idh/MocA family oxidoreductase [Lentisphaeria bacterium]|nr:Gfo/Idh/MocA family oxidoreductase [Lentisphaeria bacterium]NQZ66610.1 Gfo/Idh/MocA family oxidoreductase [Lentisphaeria bacterium]
MADETKDIAGFDKTDAGVLKSKEWESVSDRKVRVGLAGYGVCCFGTAFGFQDHPNVEVVAVTDLDPDRCKIMAENARCDTMFASVEEMVRDDNVEAIFIATDAPSHARLAILALEHGKHVGSCVPAVHGSLQDAEDLYNAVKSSGMKYMMFETSAFQADCYMMREAYNAGLLGEILYSEGQYYHYFPDALGGHGNWRAGIPPMWYPTHATAYHIAVTGGSYTDVSCIGYNGGNIEHLQAENNDYNNSFDSQTALFKTSEGGMSRMNIFWGAAGSHGEYGSVQGEKAAIFGTKITPEVEDTSQFAKPQLPPTMDAGGHGGSHAYLTDEFITAILEDRDPLINIAWSLNMTVPGIVAHESSLKDGEWMPVPQYTWPPA